MRYQIRTDPKGFVVVDTWNSDTVMGWPERNHDRAFDRACKLNDRGASESSYRNADCR